MTTLVRATLALLFALTGLVVGVSTPAFACTCKVADLDRQTAKADVVFVGTVEKVTDAGGYEYVVTATHVYKGAVDRRTSVRDTPTAKGCRLGELKVGKDYVFLAKGDTAPYAADSCSGSGGANPERIAAIEALLGAGTPVEEPPPPTATRTKVEDSPPAGFARLAAPGGALVLVGLLGLVVVRRLAR